MTTQAVQMRVATIVDRKDSRCVVKSMEDNIQLPTIDCPKERKKLMAFDTDLDD